MVERVDIIGYILALFVIGVSLKIYLDSDTFNLKCIVSHVDGNKYCVRETIKSQETADLLANVTVKLTRLVNIAHNKYPSKENIKRLHKNFNPRKIKEILPTSEYTAFSENKGEKIAFCTTTTKEGGEMIDENTLTFVALHELSHIMTESIGHKNEFWANFKFLLKIAVDNKLYIPIDYSKKKQGYCGMDIVDNPYYGEK
jgi:hypothetical protein